MKKIILLSFILLGLTINAQIINIYSNEFTSTNNLADWNNKDLTGNNAVAGIWKQYSAATSQTFPTAANGYAVFTSSTDNGSQYVDDGKPENASLELKNSFSCNGMTSVFISFHQYFGYLTTYNGRIYLEGSTDGTNWSTIYTDSVWESDFIDYNGTQATRVDASSVLANASTAYVRFRYIGSHAGIWRVDDLKVYGPHTYDLRAYNITSNAYRSYNPNQQVKFWVQNLGATTLTSINCDLYINGSKENATPYTITGLNIAPLAYQELTLNSNWDPTEGFYTLQVRTTDLNMSNPDADLTNNNTNIQNVVVYGSNVTSRKPLYEIFTSSTCPPCKPGNENYHAIVDTSNVETYTTIKYQQDFPGTGDPYCTNESVSRRGYYAVNSIPRMEIDGGWDQSASSFTGPLHNSSRALPSIIEMGGGFTFDAATKRLATKVTFKPLITLPAGSFKLYVAIVEKRTTDNVKTNQETEFTNVFKKFIGDQNGFSLDGLGAGALVSGTTTTFDSAFTFNGNYRLSADGLAANRINHNTEHSVENFDNLYAVAWIQKTDKTIMQSYTLKLSAELIDSIHKSFDSTYETASDLHKPLTCLNGAEYSWQYINESIPTNWSFASICDNNTCINAPIAPTDIYKFTGTGTAADELKLTISHNKNQGYGYVNARVWKSGDSAATVVKTKFSLLIKSTSVGSSIQEVEEAKNFYVANNTIYLTGNKKATKYNVLSLDGKTISSSLISSDKETFEAPAKGVYLIEVEFKNAKSQVIKVQQ